MKRAAVLSLKKPELLQKSRKMNRKPDIVYNFYEILERVMDENSVKDDSKAPFVFNTDESGSKNVIHMSDICDKPSVEENTLEENVSHKAKKATDEPFKERATDKNKKAKTCIPESSESETECASEMKFI